MVRTQLNNLAMMPEKLAANKRSTNAVAVIDVLAIIDVRPYRFQRKPSRR